jgi:hypothetical protein
MARYRRNAGRKSEEYIVERSGTAIATLRGKPGSRGVSTFRDYRHEERAAEEFSARIAKKVAEGWVLVDKHATVNDGLGTPQANGRRKLAADRRRSPSEVLVVLDDELRHCLRGEITWPSLKAALNRFDRIRFAARQTGWWFEGGGEAVGEVAEVILGRQIYALDGELLRADVRIRAELQVDADDADSWYQEGIRFSEVAELLDPWLGTARIVSVTTELSEL